MAAGSTRTTQSSALRCPLPPCLTCVLPYAALPVAVVLRYWLGSLAVLSAACYSLFFLDFCISSSSSSSSHPNAAFSDAAPELARFVAPAISMPHRHASPGSLKVDPLISSPHDSDSSLTLFAIKGRGNHSAPHDHIHFVSLTNVLLSYNASTRKSLILLRFTSLAQHAEVAAKAQQCWSNGPTHGRENELCSMFHAQFGLAVSPYEWSRDVADLPDRDRAALRIHPHPFLAQASNPLTQPGGWAARNSLQLSHAWSVHKWVRHQHIAHWAQKLLMFQSVFQHRSLFAPLLPPIDALVFHDTDRDINEHQQLILNASLESALDDDVALSHQAERIVWASDIEMRSGMELPTPLRRLSFTPHYGIFATHSDDTIAFRDAVYARFGLPPVSRCPPPQVTFLYRHDRRVLNRDELISWLESEYRISVVVATVNETTASREQVALFARSGLLLGSHSSQLMNVLFSQPGAAVVEVAPEFYNADFSEYAHAMGVFFQYALGGQVDPHDPLRAEQPAHEDCVAKLSACNGFSHCVVRERNRCNVHTFPNKNLAFIANATAVKIAVRNAMGHLDWLCGGQFSAAWRREGMG